LGVGGSPWSLLGKAAYKLIEPAEGADSLKLDLRLDRGKAVSGKVFDPDGKPATGVVAHGLTPESFRSLALTDGSFTAVALEPKHPRGVVFIDTARKLAGAIRLRGDERGSPVVKLQAWSAVTGRVVDADGKPCPGIRMKLLALHPYLNSGYYPAIEWIEAKTDATGRFRLDVPIGNMSKLLRPYRNGKGLQTIKELPDLNVQPGEVREVGDIAVRFQ
jgi:hypothetical protein